MLLYGNDWSSTMCQCRTKRSATHGDHHTHAYTHTRTHVITIRRKPQPQTNKPTVYTHTVELVVGHHIQVLEDDIDVVEMPCRINHDSTMVKTWRIGNGGFVNQVLR